jgi:RHS repeat-associated protein
VNGQSYTGALTWNANGTLGALNITDPFNGADSQSCSYLHDDLVRIASVNCGASTWQQNFGYDTFGNLTKTVPTGGTGNSFQPTYSAATNHITNLAGFTPSYDADGNVLNDNLNTYTWDGYGRPASLNGTSETTDAQGRLIDSGFQTETFYSPDGAFLAAFKGQLARRVFLSLPGGAQAIYDEGNGGLIQYNHPDHLGSIRLISTPARAFSYSMAYAPFGEMYARSNPNGAGSFTGQGGSTSFDLYDFPAREYSDQGRWSSPDPAGLAAVNPANPQSWNRYAYVQNNPLSSVDPTGTTGMACRKDCDMFGGGSGGFGDCSLDGVSFPCDWAISLLGSSGGVAQCPNNSCSGVGPDGRPAYFWASTNGPGNYYTYSGPGALYYSANAAGIGFESAFQGLSQTEEGEYNTTVYRDANGVYSYSDPSFSACQPLPGIPYLGCGSNPDPTNFPDGAVPVGTAHTHPLEDALNLSDIIYGMDVTGATNLFRDYPTINALYVGTVPGRVLLYVPSLYAPGRSNQCQATFVLQGPAAPAPCVPYP